MDLSGGHTIKAPAETIKANLEGSGSKAARNIENLEIALVPEQMSPIGKEYSAKLISDMQLDANESFPIGLKAHVEGRLVVWTGVPCSSCSTGQTTQIKFLLAGVELTDITEGLSHGVDKASFLSGVNTFFKFFLGEFWTRTELLSLVKDN